MGVRSIRILAAAALTGIMAVANAADAVPPNAAGASDTIATTSAAETHRGGSGDETAISHPSCGRRLARRPAAQRRRGDQGLPRPVASRRGRTIELLLRGRLLAAALELPARPRHRGVPADGPTLGARARLGPACRSQGPSSRRHLRCALCDRRLAARAAPDHLPGLLSRASVRHGDADLRPVVRRAARRPGGDSAAALALWRPCLTPCCAGSANAGGCGGLSSLSHSSCC